jgi:hypothetical protein
VVNVIAIMGFLTSSGLVSLAIISHAYSFAMPAPEPAPMVAAELNSNLFRVPVVWNQDHESNGTRAILRSYRKHHPVHYKILYAEYAESQKEKRATQPGNGKASVIAKPEYGDSEYLSPMTVGGQQFMADFDTGSADL